MRVNNIISRYETVNLRGEKLQLLPEKVIYWPDKKMLLIADLHLGKTTHFRKNGIAVPKQAENKNWLLLHQLFRNYAPERVCFLGDLFHSTHNREWDIFKELIQQYTEISFELVLGNHDILDPTLYTEIGFKVSKSLLEEPFLFTHEPLEKENIYYNLAGHIHPAVLLKGKGRQKHRAACFYFGKNKGLLPAFGSFTGLFNINIKKDELAYVVVNDHVIKM